VTEPAPSFDAVWERIGKHERAFFQTRLGVWFSYRIDGDVLCPSRTTLRIPRGDFALAYPMLPLPSPGKINRLVTGSSYVWAILHDERISGGAW
jgi:hypothetical protein